MTALDFHLACGNDTVFMYLAWLHNLCYFLCVCEEQAADGWITTTLIIHPYGVNLLIKILKKSKLTNH